VILKAYQPRLNPVAQKRQRHSTKKAGNTK